MASSSSSPPSISSYSFDRGPRLLKDFLADDSVPSCSSNDLISSFAGKSNKTNSSNDQLLRRSLSSKATSISISVIHKASEKIINAIKFFPFASIAAKSPSILPRSISRKLSRRDHKNAAKTPVLGTVVSSVHVTPKIKDILRWKSFRDVVEEMSINWYYQSDFTAEELPSWDQKKMEGQFPFDENDQHSPVSVLDNSPFRDCEGSYSFFSRSVTTIERTKCMLMQRIQEFETLAKSETLYQEEELATEEKSAAKMDDEETNGVEEKARQLLSHVKSTTYSCKNLEADVDHLLLDYFRHELDSSTASMKQKVVGLDDFEMLRFAKSWMSREYCEGTFDWELPEKRETRVRDVEIGQGWDKFDEEQQELGRELEIEVLNNLFDEILADLVTQ